MKRLSYPAILLIIGQFVLIACKDDEAEPTAEELQVDKLTATWIVGTAGSVSRDGISSDEWEDFTLTLGENTYTTTNTYPDVWPIQGSWSFVEDNLNQIVRADGLIINVDMSEDEETLTLRFTQPDKTTNGRIAGVAGEYTFVLIRQ